MAPGPWGHFAEISKPIFDPQFAIDQNPIASDAEN